MAHRGKKHTILKLVTLEVQTIPNEALFNSAATNHFTGLSSVDFFRCSQVGSWASQTPGDT